MKRASRKQKAKIPRDRKPLRPRRKHREMLAVVCAQNYLLEPHLELERPIF